MPGRCRLLPGALCRVAALPPALGLPPSRPDPWAPQVLAQPGPHREPGTPQPITVPHEPPADPLTSFLLLGTHCTLRFPPPALAQGADCRPLRAHICRAVCWALATQVVQELGAHTGQCSEAGPPTPPPGGLLATAKGRERSERVSQPHTSVLSVPAKPPGRARGPGARCRSPEWQGGVGPGPWTPGLGPLTLPQAPGTDRLS